LRRTAVVLGVLVVAALAASISLALRLTGQESVVIPEGTAYVEGVAGTWQRVNPVYASANEVDQDLAALLFSGLLRLGPSGELLPDLAALPALSDDGHTYTFALRKDARWHDGLPVTSADVAFTIGLLTAPDFKGDPALAEPWLSVTVETPDPFTVVLRLEQPSASFLARNVTLGILPEHLLANLSGAALYDDQFNSTPVGSGPYRIESLDSQQATLIANPRYHLGEPAISRVLLRFFSDSPSAIQALEAGAIEGLLVRDSLTDAEADQLGKVRGATVDHPQRAAFLVLYLNNDQAAFFQDERARRAISLALDRQEIVAKVYAGAARASGSPVAPGTWAYVPEYDPTEPRLEEAKHLLNEAGWTPHPTTGILVREGGEFRFTIRTDNDPTRVALAAEVARQLEPLGIRATVASTTFSVLLRDFLQERKYDAAIAGWDQGPDPDPYYGWHSSQMGTAGRNIANYANLVADSLIAQGRTTTSFEVRKDAYRQFQEVWQAQAPSIVLAYPQYTYLHPEGLGGPAGAVLFTPSQRFADIHQWKR
jgi:peptide/nickel transport system substrate-binding protein